MEQLVKVTSIPFQSIRYRQQARLVPSDDVDIERRKAMARYFAFRSSGQMNGLTDMRYINQVNNTFSAAGNPIRSAAFKKAPSEGAGVTRHVASAPISQTSARRFDNIERTGHSSAAAQPDIPSEPQAVYAAQRGALELRVIQGNLSFIPPLDMTIITQYPSVHFEYTGGYNFIPSNRDQL